MTHDYNDIQRKLGNQFHLDSCVQGSSLQGPGGKGWKREMVVCVKESKWPLEAEERKEMDSPSKFPERKVFLLTS